MARKISDEAMIKATGHGPDHWFPILDEYEKTATERKQITMRLWKEHEDVLSAWWAQMTTVEWERERGKRELNQDCVGSWQMSAQKTFAGDEMAAWQAVTDADWLPGLVYEEGGEFVCEGVRVTVRAVRPGKLLRLWWHGEDGKSTIEMMFFPKKEKCAVRIQHQKLPRQDDVDVFKARWKDALAKIIS